MNYGVITVDSPVVQGNPAKINHWYHGSSETVWKHAMTTI